MALLCGTPYSRLLQRGSPAAAGPGLAHVELRADRADRRNAMRGQLIGEYLGCLFTERVRVIRTSGYAARCVDQPVHRERDRVSRPARLTVRPYEIVGVFVGHNRSHHCDAEHRPCGGPPDDPICAAHRTQPAASENSVVRAMSIMYVRCVSVRTIKPRVRGLRA